MNYQPKAETEKKKYHEDLSQLADERMRYRQLNRLKENQEGMLVRHMYINRYREFLLDICWIKFYFKIGNFNKCQTIRKK